MNSDDHNRSGAVLFPDVIDPFIRACPGPALAIRALRLVASQPVEGITGPETSPNGGSPNGNRNGKTSVHMRSLVEVPKGPSLQEGGPPDRGRVRQLRMRRMKRRSPSIVCLHWVALPAFLACGEGDSSPPGTQHPNEENRPPQDAAAITRHLVPDGLPDVDLASWETSKRALLAAEPVLRLGSEQPGPALFGYVPKAAINQDGHIVVLDEDAQEIRIFDSAGEFIESFGGRGEGPMELRQANDFDLLADGRIAIALGSASPVGGTGPIKVFERSETGWRLSEMKDFRPTPVDALCSMADGRLYSSGYVREDDTIVNEIGDSVRSFGSGYVHHSSFIRRPLSRGRVACARDQDRIIFGFSKQPIVRSYGTDGSLLWVAAIVDDYRQLQIAERRHPQTGAIGYRELRSEDHDRLSNIAILPSGDQALLQYSRVFPERQEIIPQSYLIDVPTGLGAFIGDSLPNLLSIQHDGYIASFGYPFPYLEVRKFSELGTWPTR